MIPTYKDKPKAETERSKTFIDIDQTANRTLSSFRKTYNSFFNRTTFLQKEKNKMLGTLSSKNSMKSYCKVDRGEMFQKVLLCMKEAKEKFRFNNDLYSKIYHKTFITKSDIRMNNEDGYRRIFIEKIINNKDILEMYDKAVTQVNNLIM